MIATRANAKAHDAFREAEPICKRADSRSFSAINSTQASRSGDRSRKVGAIVLSLSKEWRESPVRAFSTSSKSYCCISPTTQTATPHNGQSFSHRMRAVNPNIKSASE